MDIFQNFTESRKQKIIFEVYTKTGKIRKYTKKLIKKKIPHKYKVPRGI